MAFPLKDVRYSTRRQRRGETSDGEDGVAGVVAEARTLYPRLLRDRAVLPKVAIAVQYFESLVGRERREMDAEVLVQFFGDHKLARCVVAALATSYRYRSPEFTDVCSQTALRRLERAEAGTPKALRAYLYARLNGKDGSGDGFLRREEQAATYGSLERSFALRAGRLERLLYLDAPEHAVLTRIGPAPRPEDVVAQYNYGVLETLLRHAQTIDLTLTDGSGRGELAGTVAGVRALGAANDVELTLRRAGPGAVALHLAGRADAFGGWARHGRRVARTVVQLLERGRQTVAEGTALVVLRDRRAALRLTPEVLDFLSGGAAAPDAGWDDLPGWDAPALAAGLAASRGAPWRRKSDGPDGAGGSWGLRRLPEAQAWATGVLVPDVRLVRGSTGVRVCAARSARHGERLATIAAGAQSGEQVVFFGAPEAVAPLLAAGQRALATPEVDLRPLLGTL
jgi:hypothetical protein